LTFSAILTLAPRSEHFFCVLCTASSTSPATTTVQDGSNDKALGIANKPMYCRHRFISYWV